MSTMTTTTTATVEAILATAVLAVDAAPKNKLMKIAISATASAELKAKIATIQEMSDEGWEIAEIALAFGISKAWASMLRRDYTYFFYCGTCGAQVATKQAECRFCR